ncbi:uncharacterized protein A4U43_UnF6050 [Asparagus officinalis]|uniref:Uncharacterized protein n=1 Tax=Asparagus officinalis TaxID=4686 RepID=A0A1R3L6J8_ASPOF|nr:uncharacterized protein A4U43_UnF6050 [Asparagus officinalis]
MASYYVISRGRVCLSKEPIDHHGNDGTRDSNVRHAFNEHVLLYLEGGSQQKIEAIRFGDYRTLREMITNVKFSIPKEDTSGKPHFLFGESNSNGTFIFNWVKEHWNKHAKADVHYPIGDTRFLWLDKTNGYPMVVPSSWSMLSSLLRGA